MKNFHGLVLNSSASIRQAMETIDKGAVRIALIIDSDDRLIGTISDGDIRRAILGGKSLDASIEGTYCSEPVTATTDTKRETLLTLAHEHAISKIPLVSSDGKLIGLETLDDLITPTKKDNHVVLMVGGLGTRLRPLTESTPKPMLHVGGKPILQTIVERFVSYGFVNLTLCLNYKSEIIRNYFDDGSKFGANIDYILEEKRMGTAGALSLMKRSLDAPFFVMNGDLLTSVNFESLLDFHVDNNALGTMCVREYDFQVPYGVVEVDGASIKSIHEKPVHKFFVSAGIYMLSPEVLGMIPCDEFFDMPTLFEKIVEEHEVRAISFPLREYWIDIGRIEEYEKANSEYSGVFS